MWSQSAQVIYKFLWTSASASATVNSLAFRKGSSSQVYAMSNCAQLIEANSGRFSYTVVGEERHRTAKDRCRQAWIRCWMLCLHSLLALPASLSIWLALPASLSICLALSACLQLSVNLAMERNEELSLAIFVGNVRTLFKTGPTASELIRLRPLCQRLSQHRYLQVSLESNLES